MQTSHFKHRYFCWICGKAVELETCKTDEHDMSVHGDCYYLKVALGTEAMRPVRKPAHRVRVILSDVPSRGSSPL